MKWKRLVLFISISLLFTASVVSFFSNAEAAPLDPSPGLNVVGTPAPILDPEYLGDPIDPIEYDGFNPAGFLEYDRDDHFVYQQIIHGRPVTIAWEFGMTVDEDIRQSVNDVYFDAFSSWWDVFGGFPYESYTVVLKADPGFQNKGEHGIGYEIAGAEILDWCFMSETNEINFLNAKIGHEVFHAWNNGALSIDSGAEYWFREGIANYYGQRFAGFDEYQLWMDGQLDFYNGEIAGTGCDLSLAEAGETWGEQSSCPLRNINYFKGALVSYLIDRKLSEDGLNLDDLMKYLYREFDYGRQSFSNEDIKDALDLITGEDWSAFFDDYVYGSAPINLTGSFQYLDHTSRD